MVKRQAKKISLHFQKMQLEWMRAYVTVSKEKIK